MEPPSSHPDFPKHRSTDPPRTPNTLFSESIDAYRNWDVGGFRPAAEQTEFCTPLMPIAGKTVGVAATATKLGVIGVGGNVKLPGTPVTAAPLPIEYGTDCTPPVVPSATNRNLPAASIAIATGCGSGTRVPTVRVVPLEFILNARIPLVLFDVLVSHAGSPLIIAYA